MNSIFNILQLIWHKVNDPKTSEHIRKLNENLYNIGTGLQDALKGIRTTVKNTKDVVDDFTVKTPKVDEVEKVESKKVIVEE